MSDTDVHVPPVASQYPSSVLGGQVALSQTKVHHDTPSDVSVLAEVAMDLARTNGKVTADDLRTRTRNAPRKTSNYGAAFRKLVTEGKLVLSHFQHSQTPANNGRRIGVYVIPKSPGHRVCP